MLPPTIPTSFVPHPGSGGAQARRSSVEIGGLFGITAYALLGIAFLLAIAVFSYGRILAASESAKAEELAKAQANIDPATVQNFVSLRDRLSSSATLLNSHVAFSNFFSLLESTMPANVRFTTVHLSTDDSRAVRLEASGVAKSFNALAAVSTAFAKDGRVKDAIFSNITINRADNSITFALVASLDPRLTSFLPPAL